MNTKRARILLAILGFMGVVILSASFAINPGPPSGISNTQLMIWGAQNERLIQAGAWLQIVGSFLQVVLILGILYITGTIRQFIGILIAVAVLLIMGISLTESSFYLSAIASGVSGDLEGLHIGLILIASIQHAYTIIPAPVLDAGLGFILLTTPFFRGIFGRILGYLGFAFGIVLLIVGFINTFIPFQQVVNNILTVQQVWLIAITIAIAMYAGRAANDAASTQSATAVA